MTSSSKPEVALQSEEDQAMLRPQVIRDVYAATAGNKWSYRTFREIWSWGFYSATLC